jgi:hypothetical protein
MTDNEILETGALCEALLSSMHFKTIVAQYEMTIAADFLATKQEDKQKREDLYASLWGARGLLEYMTLNARTAAAIKDKDNQPPTDTIETDYYSSDDFDVFEEENDY